MQLQPSDHVMKPGPFVRAEVGEFTPKTPGPTPPHNSLGNLDRRVLIGRMDLQLKNRPRLDIDAAENAAASNGKIVERAIARHKIRRAE